MPKILVIEDTENNRIIISRRLKAMKHEVHLCEDAEQGIVAAQELQPHLILMDIGLPGMDGWAATRALRTNPATATIPIIALTAHAMAGDREKAIDAGCNDYETKPIDFPSLFAKIDALTGGQPPATALGVPPA
ncbi:MAG: response regulator [Proteobacteria bacterium]|nr:response regulator [Verrucomicrobiota bacterium]NBU08459.1 response regulator [Pseudomonadota bacterium]NDE98400.1 response regulator [Verrucomicrobiota bacterium]